MLFRVGRKCDLLDFVINRSQQSLGDGLNIIMIEVVLIFLLIKAFVKI